MPEERKKKDLFLDCVHCGLCLPQCPTYRELGTEADSPRGRIYLIRAVEEGTLSWSPRSAGHLDSCLGCRACETACPAGVQFGRLLEDARADIEGALPRPLLVRGFRRFVFGYLFQSPARLHAAFRLLRLYQASGLRRLAHRSGLLRSLSARLYELDGMLPDIPRGNQVIRAGMTYPAYGKRRYRVAFFLGCVMNELMGAIQQATVEVLRFNGCDVIVPEGQACCGALHSHSGERKWALRLLKINSEVFAELDVDGVLTNAAGCGAMLKEYGDLGSHHSEIVEKAQHVADKTEDVGQFLDRIGCRKPEGRLERRVAYDDPCHLIHGQKISRQPRALLKLIPGIQWCELPDSDHCCGSAGTYSITQTELSMRILEKKMRAIAAVGPEIVATGNPGCLMQLRYGAKRFGIPVEVRHPIELLASAYGIAGDNGKR